MRFLLIFFLFTYYQGHSQNLIPNPYFNSVRDCASNSPRDFFSDWYNPTSGYRNMPHHPCLNNIPFSPYGVMLPKFPKKGEGMISILLLSDQFKEYKSYIATELSHPLRKNIPYLVRFYISPLEEQNDFRNMVTDVIGMYLSKIGRAS